MQIQSILVLFLVVCCVCISGRPDCIKIRRGCENCPRRDQTRLIKTLNDRCRTKTQRNWVWANQTQCDIQRISCENPSKKLDCNIIARLANMPRRRN